MLMRATHQSTKHIIGTAIDANAGRGRRYANHPNFEAGHQLI